VRRQAAVAASALIPLDVRQAAALQHLGAFLPCLWYTRVDADHAEPAIGIGVIVIEIARQPTY
jgi:hypothetical protein